MSILKKLTTVVGAAVLAKLPSSKRQYVVRLNNAATTPPFVQTLRKVNEFLKTYGALHRGAGPCASITYKKIAEATLLIRRFFGVSETHTLLFSSNTSAAINLLVRLLHLTRREVVLLSSIEHTSNHLPWLLSCRAKTVYINSFPDGGFDYDDFQRKLKRYRSRVRWVSITGASNLTGYIPDIENIATLTHRAGAFLFVDAAQLAPHRPIDMKRLGIDALAFSAHKIYAPFGLGVLALPQKLLKQTPVDPGGGSIDMLGQDLHSIVWAPPEVRHQTGTWNTTGIIALAASCEQIKKVGWNTLVRHECELRDRLVTKLAHVPGVTLYITPEQYKREERIGAVAFNLAGYHHALLSAILEHEYGIETRAGTICNHRLVRRWFGTSDAKQKSIERRIAKGNRLASYGIVRVSLGAYNTKHDVDTFVHALLTIQKHGPKLKYKPVPTEETFESLGYR